ncbi:hypothetical protein SAMN05444375_107138 [Segatella baroniae B14]|nr:hypothetical protein SAMN04487899_104118 [Segatella bryantii]SEQ30130.1 hypothetical protein SAMN05444375_107138 [Segatella baroniae B14]
MLQVELYVKLQSIFVFYFKINKNLFILQILYAFF